MSIRSWKTTWSRLRHPAGADRHVASVSRCRTPLTCITSRVPYRLHSVRYDISRTYSTSGAFRASTEHGLLQHAISTGIQSLEQMEPRSGPKFTHSLNHKLPLHQTVLDLWCLLLDIRCERYGHSGAERVFEDLAKLCPNDFPCNGLQADRLWRGFVVAGSHNIAFLKSICTKELRIGAPRQHFILEVCRSLLKSSNASLTSSFGADLLVHHRLDENDLFEIFQAVNDLGQETWSRLVHEMKTLFQEHSLYDRVVQYLIKNDQIARAWVMHRFFLSIGDLPRDFKSLVPLIEDLATTSSGIKSFMDNLRYAGASFEGQIRRCYEGGLSLRTGFSTTNLNIVSSRTFGLEPWAISDDFAARAFATSAFSFDFMLNALHLLGLVAIGPLTLREIALDAVKPQEVKRRLARMQEVGIDTGSSTYVRLVKHLIAHGKKKDLATLLRSDQHPDVFDDISTQKQLLLHYMSVGDQASINQTMVLLELHHSSNHLVEPPINILLVCAIQARDLSAVCAVWNSALSSTTGASKTYAQVILAHLHPLTLPNVTRSSQEVMTALSFTVSVAESVTPTPGHLELDILKEAMIRFGLIGEYEKAEKTALMIASKLSQSQSKSALQPSLNSMFLPAVQRAIVSWSFGGRISNDDAANIPDPDGQDEPEQMDGHLRGVRLLRRLDQDYGLTVSTEDIRGEFVLCLRLLSSQSPSKACQVREVEQEHRRTLGQYLSAFNRIWNQHPNRQEENATIGQILRLKQASRRYKRKNLAEEATAVARVETAQPPQDDVVVYRDVFTASWEDYKET